jgi:hypothetical protein
MSQKDSTLNSVTSLNTYRTKEDFFKQNKQYYKNYIFNANWETSAHLGYKVPKYYQFTDTNFYAYEIYVRAFNFNGSLIAEGKTKWIKTYKDSYSLFGGGNNNMYCVLNGYHAIYDKDGYAQEAFYSDYLDIFYVDLINKIETKKIEVLLKSNPKLLEKYLNEKKESDKKAWKRNKVSTEMRYFKSYVMEYSK